MSSVEKVDLERYKKLAKVTRIILQVSFWISVVAAVVALIGAVVLWVSPVGRFPLDATGSFSFELSNAVRLQLDSETLPGTFMAGYFGSILLMGSLIAALVAPIFYQLANLLKTVETNTPFAAANARRLTVIGMILLAGSIVVSFAESWVLLQFVNLLNLTNMSVNFSIDVTMFLTGLLVLILAGIFRYGSYLQEEFDETV